MVFFFLFQLEITQASWRIKGEIEKNYRDVGVLGEVNKKGDALSFSLIYFKWIF